jgi:hypothetical protein
VSESVDNARRGSTHACGDGYRLRFAVRDGAWGLPPSGVQLALLKDARMLANGAFVPSNATRADPALARLSSRGRGCHAMKRFIAASLGALLVLEEGCSATRFGRVRHMCSARKSLHCRFAR